MLLTKTRPDEWVSARQVKSSFSFPVIKQVGKHTLQSEPFGLGWIAQCIVKIQLVSVSEKKPKRLQATCTLSALPGSISASPGSVSFRASVESKPPPKKKRKGLTAQKTFLGTFVLAESEFCTKKRLDVSITTSFSNDAAPPAAVPKVKAQSSQATTPDVLPEVTIPDVVLPEVTPPDVLPEAPQSDDAGPSETTLPDIVPPSPDVSLPDTTSPDIVVLDVPPDDTLPDIDHPEDATADIVPEVPSPDDTLPDIDYPENDFADVVPDVLPLDDTLPDMDHPEDIPADVDSPEVTPPDIGPPEEPLPQAPRPDPALTYWSRILKVMKSTLDNDGKLPIDLKFMVRTRISPRGRIGHPKAIFASSVLVEGYTAYLDKYIKTSAPLVDLDSDGHKDTEWDAYDYDGDSDFDEDDDNDADTEDLDAVMTATTDFDFEPVQEEPDSSDPPPLSTPTKWPSMFTPGSPSQVFSLLVDMDTALATGGSVAESSASVGRSAFSQRDKSRGSNKQRAVRLGSVWHVKDTAYTTWKAFLAYLYTQEISFAPLKSSGIPRTATSKDACSPKSMYRLAVKAGLDSLKDLAFESIRSQLTPSNIVDEVFSGCTHRYPELLDMEVRYLLEQFNNPVIYPQWERKMEEVGRGACPQGAAVVNRVMRLTLLEQKLSDENSQTPAH
ncbi:hypothetical protein EDD18DRAFT_770603 [Armillaria luteobubalina]|uniref:BTB domain-containing protein n=1 Tax=Armillaria luteobubalina TaxID=153913 RepID=A0AA39UGV7_9AGAR|nr:hypothetical protein EDD18DRAFT_770603 [Armillaria luteobubalina]